MKFCINCKHYNETNKDGHHQHTCKVFAEGIICMITGNSKFDHSRIVTCHANRHHIEKLIPDKSIPCGRGGRHFSKIES